MAEIINMMSRKVTQERSKHEETMERIKEVSRIGILSILESLDEPRLTVGHANDLSILAQSIADLMTMAAFEISRVEPLQK